MKLYTEEQVLNSMKSVKYYVEHYHPDVIDKIIDKHFKALQPIELPSDEEIEEESSKWRAPGQAFRVGAKWMREKILKNK